MSHEHRAGPTFRPRMVLAHTDRVYAASCQRHFRRLGWDVQLAASARQARQLAGRVSADLVLLATELPDESGWLTCDKMVREQPARKVILVTERVTPRRTAFADFVGAAGLVSKADGIPALVEQAQGSELSATA